MPGAALPAESVSAEVAPGEALAGAKLAEAPAGRPAALSATAPEKPLLPVTAIDETPAAPWEVATAAGDAPRPKSWVAAQPEVLLPGKQTESTACNSRPLGATPVWPCWRSKKPTPSIVTGRLAVWKLDETVNFPSKALRAAEIRAAQGPPETQVGAGISTIIVSPAASLTTRW